MKIRWLRGWGGEQGYIIKMKIRIYSEFIESNKYVFYKVINKKRKKLIVAFFQMIIL